MTYKFQLNADLKEVWSRLAGENFKADVAELVSGELVSRSREFKSPHRLHIATGGQRCEHSLK